MNKSFKKVYNLAVSLPIFPNSNSFLIAEFDSFFV